MTFKILVVDDEAVYLTRLIEQNFEDNIQLKEYEFIYAENGKQALEIIHASCPDLLLTDIRMPNLDGIELLRQLNKEKLELKTIVITAYGTIDHIRQAMQQRAWDFLVKPLNRHELKASVEKLLLLPSENPKSRVIPAEKSAKNRLSSKVHYGSVLRLAKELPQIQRSTLVSDLIKTLSLKQLDNLQEDFPVLRLMVEEEEVQREILVQQDRQRLAQDKFPLLLLEEGYIEERFPKKKLASGEVQPRYLYLRWLDPETKQLKGRLIRKKDLEDPEVCEIVEKKLALIRKKNEEKP